MNLLFWKKKKPAQVGTKCRVSSLIICATGEARVRAEARALIQGRIVYLRGELMTGDREVRVNPGDVLRIGRKEYKLDDTGIFYAEGRS